MKNILILILSLLFVPIMGSTQIIENIDEITPFHDEVAAVRKGDKWAFINTKGEIIIDYRDDLVWTSYVKVKSEKKIIRKEPTKYPIFSEGRCLIKQLIDGITYYGYIDKNGKTVIEPAFLNATTFDKGHAIVLKLSQEKLGTNELLDKKMVSYSYDEVVIDPEGNIKAYLKGPEHIVLTKDKMKWPPKIQSQSVSSDLAATKTKDDNWELVPLNFPN